jgi:hypothetical protein
MFKKYISDIKALLGDYPGHRTSGRGGGEAGSHSCFDTYNIGEKNFIKKFFGGSLDQIKKGSSHEETTSFEGERDLFSSKLLITLQTSCFRLPVQLRCNKMPAS